MSIQSTKRRILGFAAASVVALAAAFGTASAAPAPIEAMKTITASFDANSDGIVTAAEHHDFTSTAFVSMDADADQRIDETEFLEWDMGFAYIAEGLGRSDTYSQVKRDIFAGWDADGDGAVSLSEANAWAAAEFINADADADGAVVARDLATGSASFAAMLSAVRS